MSNDKQTVSQTTSGATLVPRATSAQTNHQEFPKQQHITSCKANEASESSSSSANGNPTNTSNLDEAFSPSRLLRDLRDELLSHRFNSESSASHEKPSGSSGSNHSSQAAGHPKKKKECMIM